MASRRRRRLAPGEVVLRPVHPNAGITAAYRRALLGLLREMSEDVCAIVTAQYAADPPEMAMDRTPADKLKDAVEMMARRWLGRFDEAAPRMAKWFSTSVEQRSTKAMQSILRKGGFSVRFQMTPAMQDALDATTAQNVGLIKSIPQEYLGEVNGLVMRAVQTGGDLKTLTDELEARYGITRRRAAFIARDQSNKATACMTRARQDELGIAEAIWQHSYGGKEPRPTHLANSGKRYDVKIGWYDPAVKRYIFPGELPNCRCVSRSVVKGFS